MEVITVEIWTSFWCFSVIFVVVPFLGRVAHSLIQNVFTFYSFRPVIEICRC